MKKNIKKVFALLLCTVMLFGYAPLSGFVGLQLPDFGFSISAKADYTEGIYTYTVTNNKATITSCDTSARGNITIPSTLGGYPVTAIGSSAFERYENITSVTIPDSVTNIGEYAFYACRRLTSVIIPDSVTSIGNSVFGDCTNLTSITVDPDNKYYSSDSFGVLFNKNKTELIQYPIGNSRTSYTIPDGVIKICDQAFELCTSLTSVTLPDSTTNIGIYAFYDCENLANVAIGNGVRIIGDYAFQYCQSLTSITIPNSVTSICKYAFCNCTSLTSVTICNSVTSIGQSAFDDCTSLTSVTLGNSVTSIGNYAFNNCRSLTNITIPNSVTSIGNYAFYNCRNLTSIAIGNSLKSIGDSAFEDCTSLANIIVDPNNNYYSSDSFGVLFNKDKTELKMYPVGNKRTSYEIPDSVTSIGNSAFKDCTNLANVAIGNGVRIIGDYAFQYCQSLTSITIPNSVTNIGKYAFYYCTSLASLSIGNGVTSIGARAFAYCRGFTSVTLSDKIVFSDNPFDSSTLKTIYCTCNSDSNIIKNNFVRYNYSFVQLEHQFTDGICDICGESVFLTDKNGTLIKYQGLNNDVAIPTDVTSIGQGAFKDNTNLTSVTIPDSVTNIGDYAFQGCTGLTEVAIPDSVTAIGEDAFKDCVSLNKVTYTGTDSNWAVISFENYYSNPTYYSNDLYINDTLLTDIIIQSGTIAINHDAFYNCTSITNITIPSSVTSIGTGAFRNCINLKTITVYNDRIDIDVLALNNCPSLKTVYYSCACEKSLVQTMLGRFGNYTYIQLEHQFVNGKCKICEEESDFVIDENGVLVKYRGLGGDITIPNNVTAIGNEVFYNCSELTSVAISDSVTYIGERAFAFCENLTKINLPQNINIISFELLKGCSSLKSITIPNGVTQIATQAFWDCTNLETIIIPDSVTSIGQSAFWGCSNLKSITIPRGVTKINAQTFRGCTSLTELEIPDGVTSIGENAFSECINLSQITIPNSITNISDWAFFNCSKLNNVIIPEHVTSINNYTFRKCTSLTNIIIPESITSIGALAFEYCINLTSIAIPDSVVSISTSAFDHCNNLTVKCSSNSYAHTFCIQNSIPFILTDISVQTTNSTRYNGHTYIRYEDKYSWEQAEAICESLGGHLVTITSADEQSIVYDLVKNATGSVSYWIGAEDHRSEGQWEWVTGEAFSYSNWNAGEPNNGNGSYEQDVASVYTSAQGNNAGTWDDGTESETFGFICEIENQNLPQNIMPTQKTVYGGNTYAFYDISLSWNEAKTFCESLGGHLAVITTAEEEAAISGCAASSEKNGYFLGATDFEAEGNWKWITGESWGYSIWLSGQPSNSANAEHYLEIWEHGSGWNDMTQEGDGNRGFICEFEDYFIPVSTTIYNGHLYSVYNESLSWSEAKQVCNNMGGHLVTITSEEEQNIITGLASNKYNNAYWIGLSDEESEGNWKWVTGETLSFTNWGSGQPSTPEEDYVEMNAGKSNPSSAGKWNDSRIRSVDWSTNEYYSFGNVGFICEIDSLNFAPATTGYYEHNKYEAYPNGMTWEDAELFAESKGGHLVTISDNSELNAVMNLLTPFPANSYLWIGMKCSKYSRDFKWITNEPVNINNWHAGEPNNSANVELYVQLITDGTLNDCQNIGANKCGNGFIIEYENARSKVTFTDKYSNDWGSIFAINNSTISITEPTLAHNTFGGWYRDSNLSEPWMIDSDVVTQDITLYAKWIPEEYTLTFNSNGGNCEITNKPIFFGEEVGTLPIPQRNGYTFLGWYSEEDSGNKLDEEDIILSSSNITVYACWVKADSINCGENIEWVFENNTLIINGTGEMKDFYSGESPWSQLSEYIFDVVINPGITSIGSYAFDNCTHITSITLPESISNVNEGAFDGCNSLERIDIMNPFCELPENFTSLSENVTIYSFDNSTADIFAYNNGYDFISMGSSGSDRGFAWTYTEESKTLVIIGSGEMPDYNLLEIPWLSVKSKVEKVVFDDRITYIGGFALYEFNKVSDISFPKSLKNLGTWVLEGTEWLHHKSNGLVTIGTIAYTLRGDVPENSIVLGKGIKTISSNFPLQYYTSHSNPESIQISSTVCNISKGALAFPGLKELTVSPGNPYFKSVNNVLYSKDGKELICYPTGLGNSFTVPNSVTKITSEAFRSCYNITELFIGKNVTEIADDAFFLSNISTIHGYYGSYAHQYALNLGADFVPFISNVTLDFNGADESNSSFTVNTGCEIGELPIPEKDGYIFAGWYYEDDDSSTLVTESFIVDSDITLYAYWEEIPVDAPTLQSISVQSLPDDTNYFEGENLNTEGIVLQLTYSDGNIKNITEGFYCIPFKLTNSGNQEITVSYSGLTTTFNVNVTPVIPVSVSINHLPNTTTYFEGDKIDPKGMIATVTYNNGTQQQIKNTGKFEYVYDFSVASDSSTVTVNYEENNITVTAFYQVEVLVSPSVYSTTSSVSAGNTVAVPIYISNNSGIMGFVIKLNYDPSVFTPIDVVSNIGGNMSSDIGYGSDGTVKVIWYDSSEFTNDGMFFTAYFQLASRMEPGNYPIEIAYEIDDTFDENYSNVKLTCSDAYVNVDSDSSVSFMYFDNITTSADSYVDIPIRMENNIGIEDLTTLTFNYDTSAFEFISATEAINDAIIRVSSNASLGRVTVLLNEIGSDVADGTIVTIRLKVNDTAAGNYSFRFTASDLNWVTEAGTISVLHEIEPITIHAEQSASISGNSLSIPVSISNNTGLMGYHLTFNYDSDLLEFVNVEENDEWGGTFEYNETDGVITVLWSNNKDVALSDTMFTLNFISKEVTDTSETVIEIENVVEDTFNENWKTVELELQNIIVNIVPDRFTATFVSNGNVISVQEYNLSTKKLDEPDVPSVPFKLNGRWEKYDLSKGGNIIINAIYDSPSTLLPASKTIVTGETKRIISSSNYTVERKEWYSDNPYVATVDSHGNITAIADGECYIKVTCYGKDELGNPIKSSDTIVVSVITQKKPLTFKEWCRQQFDNFFSYTLHDIINSFVKVFVHYILPFVN